MSCLSTSQRSADLDLGQDKYCWKCHMEKPNVHCGTCPRSFHLYCSWDMIGYPGPLLLSDKSPANKAIVEELIVCPECLVNETTTLDRFKSLSNEQLVKLFSILCKLLREVYQPSVKTLPFINLNEYKNSKISIKTFKKTVAKAVDVREVERMVRDGEIRTVEGFFGALKWMIHNSVIFFGVTSEESLYGKDLLEYIKGELNLAMMCPQCYILVRSGKKKSSDYLALCPIPHVVGWAKIVGFPWWPVKVVGVTGEKVEASFFGDYTRCEVTKSSCYVFSTEPPAALPKTRPQKEKYQKALKEAKEYIKAMSECFGKVVMAGNKIPLEKPYAETLAEMFPDYKEE